MAIDLDQLMDMLEESEALLLEPRECYDAALVGITAGAFGNPVAVYDCELCIEALQAANGWDREEAVEWFQFNTMGAYVGESTPMFIDLLVK